MSSAKIELLDIFSYSCMNCLRSLEYIKKLDKRYGKFGLATILVHVPEWEFEKNKSNIQKAIKKYKIKFPKIIDKDRKLLGRMKINFWPAQILLKDARTEIRTEFGVHYMEFGTNYVDGKEVYRHVGEGNYKLLENKIRTELGINKISKLLFKTEPKYSKHPTIYAGSRKNGKVSGSYDAEDMKYGTIYANGSFLQKKEYLESIGKGSIKIKTRCKIINIVAESLTKKSIMIKISSNKRKKKGKNHKKINTKVIRICNPRLYTLNQSKKTNPQILEIETNKGLAVYSFSFQ